MAERKKRSGWSLLFLGINIAILYYLITADEQLQGSVAGFQGFWLPALGIALFFMVAYLLLDAYQLYRLLYFYTGKRDFGLCMKVCILGKYYDGITPLATGGQPFQIYAMTKKQVSVAHSSGMILMKYFIYQMVFCIFGVICVTFNLLSGADLRPLYYLLAIIALVIQFVLPFTIFILATHEKPTQKFLAFFLKLGHKLHFFKNLEQSQQNLKDKISQFSESFDTLKKDRHNMLQLFLLTFAQILFFVLIPFVIYVSYEPQILLRPSFWFTMGSYTCVYLFVYFVMSIFPLPGGSGAAEFGFLFMMQPFYQAGSISIAILLWRLITYYFPIFLGFLLVVKDAISPFLRTRSK